MFKVTFLLFTVAASLTVYAQGTPDARDLLTRSDAAVVDSLNDATTTTLELRASVSLLVEAPGTQTKVDTSIAWESAAHRFRYRAFAGPIETLTMVSDGKDTWTYFPATNTYTVTERTPPLSRLQRTAGFENVLFGRTAANIQSAQFLREDSVELEGRQVRCYVVRAEYAHVPGLLNSQSAVRTVWLDQERDLVLKDLWEGTLVRRNADAAQAHYTFIYPSIHVGGDVDEKQLTFQPPEGSTQVAKPPQLGPEPRVIAPPDVNLPRSGDPSGPRSNPSPSAWAPVQRVAAQFTEEARAAGYQGTAMVYVELGNSQNPTHVELIAGLGMGLDEKALEAVKQWQFKPSSTTLAEAVEVPFQIEPEGWRLRATPFTVERDKRKRVNSIVPPVLSHYVRPDPAACSAGTASLKLGVFIDVEGKPDNLKVTEGEDSAVNEAAMKAVEGWRFSPALVDGKPAAARGTLDLECRSTPAPAGAPGNPAATYRIGGGVSPPIVLSKVDPDYSEKARRAKLEGTVLLAVEVTPSGRAKNIRVVRFLGLGLDAKAIEAVANWRFRPGMKGGKPVTVAATIEVNFRLI